MMSRWAIILVVVGIGCGRSAAPPVMDPVQDRLTKVAVCYLMAGDELKRPPAAAADLKAVARKRGFADDIWQSPNDQEPFVIIWGIDVKKPGSTLPILAHEKTGKDGKVWTVNMMNMTAQMTGDELKKAIARSP